MSAIRTTVPPVCPERAEAAAIPEAPALVSVGAGELALSVERFAGVDEGNPAADTSDLTVLMHRTIGEALLERDCSVRLSNCMQANTGFFSAWTIGRALANRSQFASALMRVRNLGRKTANEVLDALEALTLNSKVEVEEPTVVDPLSAFDPARLDALIRDVLERLHVSVRLSNLLATGAVDDLTVRNFCLQPDQVRARMMGCKNAGRKTVAEAFERLTAYVEALGHSDAVAVQAEDGPPEGLTTREWIEREVSALLPNRVEVLHDRYGLNGPPSKTLQEIADRVHVSRERVRQVQAGAIKRLRADGRSRAAFERFLVEERESQWNIIFCGQSLLPQDEVTECFRRLNPWFLLAIDVVFKGGVDEYLGATAFKSTAGWFRDSGEADHRRTTDNLLKGVLKDYPTPMPLDTLAEIVPSINGTSSGSSGSWTMQEGYVFSGRVRSKALRTARMHAIARRISTQNLFDIGTLLLEYRSEFPADYCGSGLFEREAADAPHLFVPVFDSIWLCLDHSSRQPQPLCGPPFERGRVEEDHFSEGSIGGLLIARLAEFGPQRLIDLRRIITESGQGAISESSVGAVLISNPIFRRVAPGVFWLYTGTSEVPASLVTPLLEDRHCRLYCSARHSGAPHDYYPIWDAVFEMRLSSWAATNASTELYRSLMAVIEPASWPASPETIAEFQVRQERDGRWEIGAPRRLPLGHRFLDAGQFLSVLTHLVVFGWISWVGVNRATGSKIDNHDAADVLAYLVMSGLVEPVADWQAAHRPTDLARSLFLEATRERHVHGDDHGDDRVFGEVQSSLYASPPTASRGWVDAEEFRTAMPAWQSKEIWMGKAFGGAQRRQPAINAEGSFESDDWDAIFGG